MLLIRDLVQQALATGYLTIAAQEQLRQLLQTTKYEKEDINAFMALQKAAMDGHVKQEIRADAKGKASRCQSLRQCVSHRTL